jgi:hypothetical protein
VLVESSGIFSNFGAESRHIAKLQNVVGYFEKIRRGKLTLKN